LKKMTNHLSPDRSLAHSELRKSISLPHTAPPSFCLNSSLSTLTIRPAPPRVYSYSSDTAESHVLRQTSHGTSYCWSASKSPFASRQSHIDDNTFSRSVSIHRSLADAKIVINGLDRYTTHSMLKITLHAKISRYGFEEDDNEGWRNGWRIRHGDR
jgi:hypothetical protein